MFLRDFSCLLTCSVEQVVFCRLSSLQADLYRQYLRSTMVCSVLSGGQQAAALSCIISLRKLCNHPCAIFPKPEVINPLRFHVTMSAHL